MGQFFNQPDFITTAKEIQASNVIGSATFLDGASLWVGGIPTGGTGNVKVIIAGTKSGSIASLKITGRGSGYVENTNPPNVTLLRTDGTTPELNADVDIVSVDSNGGVTAINIVNSGLGFEVGDILQISGGTDPATLEVTEVTTTPIPAQAVTFKGITFGQYLPVMVDYVLVATAPACTDIIACH